MLPIRTPDKNFRTLDQIRQRKEEIYQSLQRDNEQFTKLWGSIFVKKSESTKGEWIGRLLSNSVTAIDTFLLVRKLIKNYGFIFGHKKK